MKDCARNTWTDRHRWACQPHRGHASRSICYSRVVGGKVALPCVIVIRSIHEVIRDLCDPFVEVAAQQDAMVGVGVCTELSLYLLSSVLLPVHFTDHARQWKTAVWIMPTPAVRRAPLTQRRSAEMNSTLTPMLHLKHLQADSTAAAPTTMRRLQRRFTNRLAWLFHQLHVLFEKRSPACSRGSLAEAATSMQKVHLLSSP